MYCILCEFIVQVCNSSCADYSIFLCNFLTQANLRWLGLVGWQQGVDSRVGLEASKQIRLIYHSATKCLGDIFSPIIEGANSVVKVYGALVGPDRYRSVMLIICRPMCCE
jgi:hypothetical protein